VNADDLGYTPGIDRAVSDLARAGALSSSTAMASGQSLRESVRELPADLGIGCHVVLVDGRPTADPQEIPSLLENGKFRPTLGRFTADLVRGRIREREIETEATAQIRLLQTLLKVRGFRLTHLDTHKHTHLFPRVLRPLLRAALACGVRAIRNPFEPEWSRSATSGASAIRRLQVGLLGQYRAGFLREVERAELRTTAGALGILATGVLDGVVLQSLLGALRQHGSADECYELVCHPGFHDAALDRQHTRLRVERERKALFLGIPRWIGTRDDGPHRLATFADL